MELGGKPRAGADLKLRKDGTQVILDGPDADTECRPDLLVRETGSHRLCNLIFPGT
jgi:hypothetical protein